MYSQVLEAAHPSTLRAGDPAQMVGQNFHDLTPLLVKVGHMQVLIVSVYLTVNAYDTEVNNNKLAMLVTIIRQFKIPWLVIGDWNIDPQTLKKSPAMQYLDAILLLPDGAAITCTKGEVGSMLDYGFCSPAMRPWSGT